MTAAADDVRKEVAVAARAWLLQRRDPDRIDLRRPVNELLHSPRARRERCSGIHREAYNSQREFYSSGQNASMVFCGIQR